MGERKREKEREFNFIVINLKKKHTNFEGSVTSSDSGHGSYIPSGVNDFHSENLNGSNNSGGGGVGLYQVACSIVHNSPLNPDMTRPEHGTHMTIAMDNPGHSLQAGMYCNCNFSPN